ncbi:MAG: DUF262 domain-containing protein [Deltaproteobacteria bacterium]|nr:DUF262 domain-containing protein [Deltaproteobacteria bacterium]
MKPQQAKVEVQTLKVEDVLLRLRDGSIRVPDFQRRLRWKPEDNRALFDSLLRGYPVGSLLMWVRDLDPARVRLGPFETDAPEQPRAWWVVDGQQRLTALAGALLPVAPRPPAFDFVVDLATGDVLPRGKSRTGPLVPLDILGSIDALVPWLHQHPEVELRTAAELSKRLREYPLSIIVLDVSEQAFVEDVFKRLNTAGKRLTQADVFRASHGRKRTGKALARAFAVGKEFRFGDLDESNLLRALKALSGQDPLSELTEPEPEHPEELVRGTREAVVLLRKAGVPTSELLPFALPFGVLVAFFARHSGVTQRTRELLEIWFWRATLSFELKGDFSSIRDLYERAVLRDEHEAAQALLQAVPDSPGRRGGKSHRTLKNAAGKALALMLMSNGPRHLETGQLLPAAALLESHSPRQLFQPLVPGAGAGFGLFNAIFHPRLPPARFRAALRAASPEVLASHFVEAPFAPSADWLADRQARLLLAFDAFAEQKTGVQVSTRPALAALGEPES